MQLKGDDLVTVLKTYLMSKKASKYTYDRMIDKPTPEKQNNFGIVVLMQTLKMDILRLFIHVTLKVKF